MLAAILLVASGAVLAEYIIHSSSPMSIVVPDDYPTIQAAIDHAPQGGIVYVKNGIYKELLTINKTITLIGEDNQNTIIQGYSRYPLNSLTIEIEANNVTISNFNINGYDACIEVTQQFSNCKITQNIIKNYTSCGISTQSGSNQVISNNTIIGRETDDTRGIYVSSSNSEITGNTITSNFIGVTVQSDNVTITGNIISNNGYAVSEPFYVKGGLQLLPPGPYFIFNNNITNNQGAGIDFQGGNNTAIYDNYIAENQAGIHLLNYIYYNSTVGSKITVFNNNFVDNQEQVKVSTSWMDYGTPQNIPAQAINGTDIVSWDNGTVGNYWSDYQSRYPDATQNNNTGTFNIPYTIDANNKDNHPLTNMASTFDKLQEND